MQVQINVFAESSTAGTRPLSADVGRAAADAAGAAGHGQNPHSNLLSFNNMCFIGSFDLDEQSRRKSLGDIELAPDRNICRFDRPLKFGLRYTFPADMSSSIWKWACNVSISLLSSEAFT